MFRFCWWLKIGSCLNSISGKNCLLGWISYKYGVNVHFKELRNPCWLVLDILDLLCHWTFVPLLQTFQIVFAEPQLWSTVHISTDINKPVLPNVCFFWHFAAKIQQGLFRLKYFWWGWGGIPLVGVRGHSPLKLKRILKFKESKYPIFWYIMLQTDSSQNYTQGCCFHKTAHQAEVKLQVHTGFVLLKQTPTRKSMRIHFPCFLSTLLQHLGAGTSIPSEHLVADATHPRHSVNSASSTEVLHTRTTLYGCNRITTIKSKVYTFTYYDLVKFAEKMLFDEIQNYKSDSMWLWSLWQL